MDITISLQPEERALINRIVKVLWFLRTRWHACQAYLWTCRRNARASHTYCTVPDISIKWEPLVYNHYSVEIECPTCKKLDYICVGKRLFTKLRKDSAYTYSMTHNHKHHVHHMLHVDRYCSLWCGIDADLKAAIASDLEARLDRGDYD